MKFIATPLSGAYVIDIEPLNDERGFFARTICMNEFEKQGLTADFIQQSISWNPHKGTLRGMHYQVTPHEEVKLVRVTRGAIFDVIVDMRQHSPTLGQTFSVELSAENHRQLYIPKGMAHGFQTLQADTEILYQMDTAFQPGYSRGILWSDKSLQIRWPEAANRLISDKDNALPSFTECLTY